MKKTLSLIAIVGSLLTTSAYAKTEGNYAGIDVLRTSAKHKYESNGLTGSKFDDSSIGVGVNYKHAFNFNQVFLAPGVFFDQLGTKSKDSDGGKVSASYRYGAKLDLGYDITDDFAIYFTNGFSNLLYSVDWNNTGDGKKSASKLGYVYGGGLSYKIAKNLVVNLEYNTQSVDLKTPSTGSKVASSIRVAKVGLSYNF